MSGAMGGSGGRAPTEFLQPGERTETPDAFMLIVR